MTSTCVTRHLSLIDKDCLHPIDKAAVTVAVYTGPRSNELFALTMEDVVRDFSKITARRSITQSVTFKMPKTKKGRTVLLQPPARDALKVLVADAEKCEAADLTTYACWNLTARGNLAFIANQMGHKDYSMLVTVYGRWIDTESSKELERIWEGMQNMAQITPKLHQKVTV